MSTYFKNFFIAFFAALLVFCIPLLLSSLIPSSSLQENVGKTVETFKKDGIYPSYGVPGRQIVLDNYTDSLMVNTAYSVDSSQPLRSAVSAIRRTESVGQTNQLVNLEKAYTGQAKTPIFYERYWHGYLAYLRPLLILTPYSGIRTMLSFLLYGQTAVFLYLVTKKLGIHTAIIFLIGFLSVDLFYLGQSMQFSAVFLIGLATSIYLLRKKKQGPEYILFFITGMLTSYLDLLTAPMVSVGILLITAYLLNKKRNVVTYYFSWYAGYILFWFTKLVIAQLLYFPNAMSDAWRQFAGRIADKADANFSQLAAIKLNIFQLIGYARQSKIVVLAILVIIAIFLVRYHRLKKESFKRITPLLLIGAAPYIWYLVLANHSYLHVWYVYRDQLMSVIAFLLILLEFVNWTKVHRDWTKLKSLR